MHICPVVHKRFLLIVILVYAEARKGSSGSMVLVIKELAHSCGVVAAISVNVHVII